VYVEEMRRQRQAKVRLAIVFPIAGLATLGGLLIVQDFPEDPWLWALFAAAFVFFEWNAVEVNDRLYASPSIMILFTAAVAFGPGSAILGTALMAALGPLVPADIRERRWFQPAVNVGQLILSAAIAMTVFAVIAGGSASTFADVPLPRVALASALAALAYGALNFSLVRFIVRRVFGPRSLLPWSHLPLILLPLVGMGFLGGMLGMAYVHIGTASLPLIFVVFFVGYMAFESYARLREAQESTLRGFIKALEAKDLYTRGHTERVAKFALMIGQELGFGGTELERLRWAALIHDVGKLAVPRELIRKRARLSEDEYEVMQDHVHYVEALLNEVQFLEPMVQIAANHHAHYDGNGYHGMNHVHGDIPGREACILAVADSFDAMTSTRSYRVALTQEYAFAELRRHAGTQFDPAVVEAFIEVLTRSGERYGSPIELTEDEARRRAEEAVHEIRDADQVHGRYCPVAPLGAEEGGTGG